MRNAKLEDYGEEVEFVRDLYAALNGTDCLALITERKEFANLDWQKIKTLMHGNLVADGRNLWSPDMVREAGFDYLGMGRV